MRISKKALVRKDKFHSECSQNFESKRSAIVRLKVISKETDALLGQDLRTCM